MKKPFLKISLLLIIACLATGGWYIYHHYLPGLKPVVGSPSQDIDKLIEQGESPLVYPPKFLLTVFASQLEGPRDLTMGPAGNLLVSIPAQSRVVALPDEDLNGRADRIVTVADGLDRPHGIAFAPGNELQLYIAETGSVRIYDYDAAAMQATNSRKIIDLPAGGRHYTRSLLYLADTEQDKLLISVGSSCDTCLEEDWRRATILAADPDGNNLEVFASGLRNAVFMQQHPETGAVWATEMGRDFLGDNLPPDEINIILKGHNYGWPYCYGKNTRDRKFNQEVDEPVSCGDRTPSAIDLQAHSAPLGLDFFPSTGWPEKYKNNLLVAYHGSWNRTIPTGYKVVRFLLDEQGNVQGREDFISGWLQDNNSSLGRPVDIEITSDGKIFISDDKAGVIYQLRRQD